MPAMPAGVRGAVDHRLGHRPAAQGPDQRRPRRDDGRPPTSGSASAPASSGATSAARPPGSRSSPGARRSRWRGSTRARSTRSSSPRPRPTGPSRRPRATVQAELGLRCGAFDVNAACSGFVYGLVPGPRADRDGRGEGARDRHRHPRPHHRLGRPQHGHPLRRRLGRGRARSGGRARASCSAGTSTPTARPSGSSTADIGGYLQMDGKEVFRRAVRIMVDSGEKSMKARRRDRRRHRARRAPPGQHPDHRRRLPAPRHPDGTRSRRCSRTPATRRRPRSRWRSAAGLDNGRVNDGDLVLLVGFGAGMTAASAVLRWGGDEA